MTLLERRYAKFCDEVVICGKTFKVQRIRTPEGGYAITFACNGTRLFVRDYPDTTQANISYRAISSALHDMQACLGESLSAILAKLPDADLGRVMADMATIEAAQKASAK